MFEKVFEIFYENLKEYILTRDIDVDVLSFGSISDLRDTDKYKNKIFLSVYSIVRERTISDNYSYEDYDNVFLESKVPLFFDVHVLLCSTFQEEKFIEGLQIFSEVVGYLQGTKKLSLEGMELTSKNILIDLLDKSESETLQTWQSFNLMPKPCIFFKIATVPIVGQTKRVEAHKITRVDTHVNKI